LRGHLLLDRLIQPRCRVDQGLWQRGDRRIGKGVSEFVYSQPFYFFRIIETHVQVAAFKTLKTERPKTIVNSAGVAVGLAKPHTRKDIEAGHKVIVVEFFTVIIFHHREHIPRRQVFHNIRIGQIVIGFITG